MRVTRKSRWELAGLLAESPVFHDLPEAHRTALARWVSLRIFAPGEYLFHQDSPAEGFYLILKGGVKIHRIGPDGREQVLHFLGVGEMVGEVPVFEAGDYPASADATGQVQALWIPAVGFHRAVRENPRILLGMLAVLSRRLRGFVALIDDLALKDVSARLAKYLMDRSARSQADVVELETTKAVLAARLGTIAETLSRTLRKMQQRGVIAVRGRSIWIVDHDRLAALAAGEKL